MEVNHPIEKGYLSVKDVSRYLDLKPSTVYQLVKNGEIPYYEIHKIKRFRKKEIDEWMETHRGDGTVIDKRTKSILEATKGRAKYLKIDVNRVVKKAIEEGKGSNYNENNGNQTKVKGLGKEVKNGNL